MADERVSLGHCPELFAPSTTNADPVVWSDFHEIHSRQRLVLKRTQQGPPQTKSGTRYGISAVNHRDLN